MNLSKLSVPFVSLCSFFFISTGTAFADNWQVETSVTSISAMAQATKGSAGLTISCAPDPSNKNEWEGTVMINTETDYAHELNGYVHSRFRIDGQDHFIAGTLEAEIGAATISYFGKPAGGGKPQRDAFAAFLRLLSGGTELAFDIKTLGIEATFSLKGENSALAGIREKCGPLVLRPSKYLRRYKSPPSLSPFAMTSLGGKIIATTAQIVLRSTSVSGTPSIDGFLAGKGELVEGSPDVRVILHAGERAWFADAFCGSWQRNKSICSAGPDGGQLFVVRDPKKPGYLGLCLRGKMPDECPTSFRTITGDGLYDRLSIPQEGSPLVLWLRASGS